MKNILFVCSKNQWRSPTAEVVWRKDARVNVRSAGTSAKARRSVSLKDIDWADMIFVMEKKHKQILLKKFGNAVLLAQVVILDIPDDYAYMDEDLVALLEDVVEPYIATIL